MNSIPDYVMSALRSPIKSFLTQIQWLDWQEQIIGDYSLSVLDGDISIDAAKPGRRSFSLMTENSSGLFIPGQANVNMRVKVRINRGITTSQGVYYWNRGVFILSDPESIHDKAKKEVSIQGLDKWALFDGTAGGTITEAYQIPKGTLVTDAIKAVAGIQGETRFNFDPCDVETPYQVVREPGDNLADMLTELATIPSYELFYDVDGFLRFRSITDPIGKPVLHDFSPGGPLANLYLSSAYSPEWIKIKNYWKVVGYEDPDTGEIFSGIAQDDNPNSPTNTSSPPDGIGVRAALLNDSNLTTDALCEVRAGYELSQNLKRIHRSTHKLITCPFLNEQDCVRFSDTDAGIVDGKYEIQGISEGFRGEMTVEAWRVVDI